MRFQFEGSFAERSIKRCWKVKRLSTTSRMQKQFADRRCLNVNIISPHTDHIELAQDDISILRPYQCQKQHQTHLIRT